MSQDRERDEKYFLSGAGVRSLWFSVLAPPAATVTAVGMNFSLAHIACHGASMIWLHAFTALMLAVVIAGGLLGRKNLRRSREEWPQDEYGVIPRSQFMSALAVGEAALFTLMMIAIWVPAFVLNPCYLT